MLSVYAHSTIYKNDVLCKQYCLIMSYFRSFGGEVSWPKTVGIGSTFDESDPTITHHLVDRPNPKMDHDDGHRYDKVYTKHKKLFKVVFFFIILIIL